MHPSHDPATANQGWEEKSEARQFTIRKSQSAYKPGDKKKLWHKQQTDLEDYRLSW